MVLETTCGDIASSTSDGRHDMQLLGDLLKCRNFREPVEGVDYGLLVGHGGRLPFYSSERKSRAATQMQAQLPSCASETQSFPLLRKGSWQIHAAGVEGEDVVESGDGKFLDERSVALQEAEGVGFFPSMDRDAADVVPGANLHQRQTVW